MMCCFNDPAATEIYTLSLHDALPISDASGELAERSADDLAAAVASHLTAGLRRPPGRAVVRAVDGSASGAGPLRTRSAEHTSELQSRQYLARRLLLEKKKKATS